MVGRRPSANHRHGQIHQLILANLINFIHTEDRRMKRNLRVPELLTRITVKPKQCDGRPCIRGMGTRVSDVLDLFSAGLSSEEILVEMPDLDADDLKASLAYTSRKLDHPS
jgi:uncharacterized protein (DUF433 family)